MQPTSGAGSLGVYKAFNEEELKEGVERVLNDMAHIAYLSSNPGTKQEAPVVVYVTSAPSTFPCLYCMQGNIYKRLRKANSAAGMSHHYTSPQQ